MGRPGRLAEEHRRALDRLSRVPGIERFFVVGGTAIAFHLGHRGSLDLDLFSITSDADLDGLAAALGRIIPDMRTLARTDVTLNPGPPSRAASFRRPALDVAQK